MPNAKIQILIASNAETQKKCVMTALVGLNYATSCTSATELLKNDGVFRVTDPDLAIIDLPRESFEETLLLSKQYAKRSGCPILYSIDTHDIKRFQTQHSNQPLAYICKNTSHHELELAITFLLQQSAVAELAAERRKEQWALHAITGLFQKNLNRDETLRGIVGIIATTLNSSCGILAKNHSSPTLREIAVAGAKRSLILDYYHNTNTDALISQQSLPYMRPFTITKSNGHKTPAEAPTRISKNARFANLNDIKKWQPVSGVITSITPPPALPIYFCVWSELPRQYSDNDKSIISIAAQYCGLMLHSPQTDTGTNSNSAS